LNEKFGSVEIIQIKNFIQSLLEKIQSRLDWKCKIKVRLIRIRFFRHDPDRDENFQIVF